MADKILIVDDDPAICKLLEKVMHSNELETTTVNCGMDALSILKNHTFDLILMDIMLGDMEGFEVIKRLRNQGISTPVMIVSGRNEDYDSLYGLSLGADDYITKPFRPLVLGAKVKALIRRNKNLVLDNSDTLECGPFSYDTTTMRFYKNGEELINFLPGNNGCFENSVSLWDYAERLGNLKYKILKLMYHKESDLEIIETLHLCPDDYFVIKEQLKEDFLNYINI